MSTPTVTPTQFRKGTTVQWTKDPGDYTPADGWALTCRFASPTDNQTATGADNGDGTFLFTISAETSGRFMEGDYAYVVIASKASEAFELEAGTITVLPDLTSAIDNRSHVKKTLDAIEDLIENRATRDDVAQLSISTPNGGSKSLARASWQELLEARSYYRKLYQDEVSRAAAAQGRATKRRVVVRFSNPGA